MVDNAMGLMEDGVGVKVGGYQDLVARLDLFSEAIVMTRYDASGARSCFEVDANDLAVVLTGVPVSTGLLPRECLFYSRVGGDVYMGVFIPPGSCTLTVADGDVFDVPLPPLIWAGCGVGYQVWAVKQRPGERERLFNAPFPNVYMDGTVCAGNVQFPVCSARTIHAAFELFLKSEFNSDLAANKSEGHPDNVLALWEELHDVADFLWEELHDEVDFPLDDLVKTRSVLADVLGGP